MDVGLGGESEGPLWCNAINQISIAPILAILAALIPANISWFQSSVSVALSSAKEIRLIT